MTMVVSSLLLCSWFVSRKFKPHHWVISKLLRDLEKLFAYSSRSLFENVRSTPLYEVLLDGINVCLNTLLKTPNEPVIAKKLTATMRVQLDNYANDNKSIFVLPNCLCWLQKVCSKRCLYHFFLWATQTMILMHLLGGGAWSCMKRISQALLMKLYCTWIWTIYISINPHMMKEVLNLKAFIEPYPRSGAHHLFGHTKAQ